MNNLKGTRVNRNYSHIYNLSKGNISKIEKPNLNQNISIYSLIYND